MDKAPGTIELLFFCEILAVKPSAEISRAGQTIEQSTPQEHGDYAGET
jgi:hypothetical protein